MDVQAPKTLHRGMGSCHAYDRWCTAAKAGSSLEHRLEEQL
ncbi:hypothetical protein ACWC2M_39340 [Streptomyces sp. NPDC001761]